MTGTVNPLNQYDSDNAFPGLHTSYILAEVSPQETLDGKLHPRKPRRMDRFIGALLNKPKCPAAKMNAIQAQQERERVEQVDEYWTRVGYAVACLSVTTALMAMSKYSENFIIKAAFLFPLITAPYAITQRRRINKAAFLREDVIRLRSRMMRLAQQNQRLQHQNTQLDHQERILKAADRELASILQKQGRTLQQVQELVHENGEITRKMIQLEESENLLRIVKKAQSSDRKNKHGDNLQLNEKEVNQFIRHLQIMSPRKLDEYKLRKALGTQSASNNIGNIYSIGSDPLEDMSEYEAFNFPRRPSLE